MRRIRCAEIWGGVQSCDEDILTSGITASLYSTAADGGKGGDIHYLSVCSSDLLTRIAIADVVGHGEAVAITSQWMYHALAERMNCLDGDGILNHLNHLSDEYGMDALTTAVVIGYSTDNSQLYFAYAGHPPLLVRHQKTGRWGPLHIASTSCPGNLPFGVEVETRYDQERVPLAGGDRLFLYTDGVIEAPDRHGRLLGLDPLLATLAETGDGSPAEIKSAVLQRLMKHTGGPLGHDDVTFMAIKIL
jgi:phosphoserine phosphatase RsbU/P